MLLGLASADGLLGPCSILSGWGAAGHGVSPPSAALHEVLSSSSSFFLTKLTAGGTKAVLQHQLPALQPVLGHHAMPGADVLGWCTHGDELLQVAELAVISAAC